MARNGLLTVLIFIFGFRYSKTGSLMYAGFSDPHSDPSEKDLKVWLGDDTAPPADLDVNQSRFLLEQMGDQFCELWHQEQKALEEHLAEGERPRRRVCDSLTNGIFRWIHRLEARRERHT